MTVACPGVAIKVESSTFRFNSWFNLFQLGQRTLSLSLALHHPCFLAMFKSILPGTSKRISNSEFMMVTPSLDLDIPDLAAGGDKENIEVYAPKMLPPKPAPATKMHKRAFSQAAPKEDPTVAFEQLLVGLSSTLPLIRPRF